MENCAQFEDHSNLSTSNQIAASQYESTSDGNPESNMSANRSKNEKSAEEKGEKSENRLESKFKMAREKLSIYFLASNKEATSRFVEKISLKFKIFSLFFHWKALFLYF